MLRKMFQGGFSRKQGPRLAMRDADEEPQETLQCVLVSDLLKILWIMQELKKNLTHICVMPVLRTLRQTNAPSIMISQALF